MRFFLLVYYPNFIITTESMKMLTLTPRKPIIYPPGIISLALLPIFCLIYLNEQKAFAPRNMMTIAVWSPEWQQALPKKFQHKFPPERKYLHINLDGKNEADDKIRLDFARLQIREMLKSRDTIGGVDFHFGNKAKYWTFVNALDICQTENILAYAPYKDDIYVINVIPKKITVEKLFICGNLSQNRSYLWSNYPDIMIPSFNQLIISFWAPGIAFLMMLFFSLRKLYLNLYQP